MTQIIIGFVLIIPSMLANEITPVLDLFFYSLLISFTILTAAAGNIINGIFDRHSDLVNNKNNYLPTFQSVQNARIWYLVLNIISIVISFILSIYLKDSWIYQINFTIIVFLFLYSKFFKHLPLIGNFMVSVLVAAVVGVVIVIEWQTTLARGLFYFVNVKPIESKSLIISLFAYVTFSFILTFIREIIKDIEDVEGDKKAGSKTFPIIFGIQQSKYVSQVLTVIMIVFSIWVSNILSLSLVKNIIGIVGIIFPMFYLFFKINKAQFKQDFTYLSNFLKIVMMVGLVLILLL